MLTSGPGGVADGVWSMLTFVLGALPVIVTVLVLIWLRRIDRSTAETAYLLRQLVARQDRLEQRGTEVGS